MQEEVKQLTQSEQFALKLAELRQDITEADRKDAVVELGISYTTISNYLNGTVRDNDTAAALIVFFKKRISERFDAVNK